MNHFIENKECKLMVLTAVLAIQKAKRIHYLLYILVMLYKSK